jgi:hypothetical protein
VKRQALSQPGGGRLLETTDSGEADLNQRRRGQDVCGGGRVLYHRATHPALGLS